MYSNKLLKPIAISVLILLALTLGSFGLVQISNYFQLDFFGKHDAWHEESITDVSTFKTFIFAPIFETILLYGYFKITMQSGKLYHYIIIGVGMGLLHDYYVPGAFLPILYSFWVMSFGYSYFMSNYGAFLSVIIISIIHSLNNLLFYYFF
jgi:hypothetical protein